MKKIYVVDDDRNIVESLFIVLKSKGYDVAAQYDEENLIGNVKTYRPDLIILDVMFPQNEAAGFEMARDLRNDSETQEIPILMLSAVNERSIFAGKFSNRDRDETWLPVNEFVEKPIKPKDLLDKMQAMLEAK